MSGRQRPAAPGVLRVLRRIADGEKIVWRITRYSGKRGALTLYTHWSWAWMNLYTKAVHPSTMSSLLSSKFVTPEYDEDEVRYLALTDAGREVLRGTASMPAGGAS